MLNTPSDDVSMILSKRIRKIQIAEKPSLSTEVKTTVVGAHVYTYLTYNLPVGKPLRENFQ